MSSKLSIAEVLVDLEAQIAELEKLDAFHAEREEFHRGQRADCAGKLAKIRTKYQAFQTAASEVVEVVRKRAPAPPPAPPSPPSPILPEDSGARTTVSKLVAQVVAGKREDERFTASELAVEINRRFPKSLRQPAAPRPVAMALRRLVDQGGAREEEKGKPFHEAVYARNVRRVKGR